MALLTPKGKSNREHKHYLTSRAIVRLLDQFGAGLVRVLLVGMVGTLMAAAGPARAVQIEETEIDLVIDPNGESMTAQVRLHVSGNSGTSNWSASFSSPPEWTTVARPAPGETCRISSS